MLSDLKYTLRSLSKSPGFAAIAVLILSLCIGASTAIFTVLKKVVLDPLPYPNPKQLVVLQNTYPGVGVYRGQNSVPDYFDREQLHDVFESLSLWQTTGYEIGASGSPQRIDADFVMPEFFRVLRAAPQRGRAFVDSDAVQGQDKVAILSDGLWREMFAADPDIPGRDVRLNGEAYRIIGIMPPGFSSPLPLNGASRVWLPLAIDPAWKGDDYRHSNNWQMIGRLRPGVSVRHAQERIDALNRANVDRFPRFTALTKAARFRTLVSPMKDTWVGDVRSTLYLLQAAAALLLIGCVNVASLMLVRSTARMKELALRFSLGASRWLLARQLLVESIVLSLAGGIAGLMVAWGGVRLLINLGARDLPRGADISIDGATLALNCLAALLMGVVFGCIPVRHLWRQDLTRVFRLTERTGTAERGAMRVRSLLVTSQIALAFVLLTGSALLVLSFARLLQVSPGFRTDHIATAAVNLPFERYGSDQSRIRSFIAGTIDRLEANSGVLQAGLGTYLPFSGTRQSAVILIDGRPPPAGESPPVPQWDTVSEGYFRTLGIPLLQGRTIRDSDDAKAQPVIVIDEYLAQRYWPRGNALGGRISLGLGQKDLLTVVGVVGSVKTQSLADREQVGQIYLSYKQSPPYQMYFVLRGAASEAALFTALRQGIGQMDSQLPVTDMKTMSQRVNSSLAQSRAAMVLCAVFGGVAALLAAIGIYGVLAYSMAQRTREFGIRLALGAQPGNLLGALMRQGLRLVIIGVLMGALAALALDRFIASLLYEVRPSDPLVLLSIAGLLAVIALLASYLPARSVTKVDPMVALRAE